MNQENIIIILLRSERKSIENDGTKSVAGYISRNQYHDVADKIIAALSAPLSEGDGKDAIAFAEWINKNYWWQDEVGNWIVSENDAIPAHSSSQLYQLFKDSTKQ